MRQVPHRDKVLILWALVLCLFCGASTGRPQAIASAVKKASGSKSKQKAKPAETQPEATPAPVPPPAEPEDPLGRTTPHGCVLGFLKAAEADDYVKAAQYLNGKRSDKQGEELAAQLKSLLDLGLSANINNLSRSPTGSASDKLAPGKERVGVVKTPQGEIEVLLELVKRPDRPPIWLFSQETLKLVPEAYASLQHKDYGAHFPEWMRRDSFLGVPVWRWALFLLTVVIVLTLASVLTRLFIWILRRLLGRRVTPMVEASILRLRGPIFGLMLAAALYFAAGHAITALARHYWELLGNLAAWLSGAWLLTRLTDIFVTFERQRLLLRMRVERVTFLGLMSRFFKILIAIVIFIVLLHGAGVDVSAVIAGLGIGGIALALAAQSTLADLFGGLSVVLRGAVRVGDFCQIDGMQGTVEDIGISSLSLRTLDRSVVSIPNSKVAQVKLENFAMRDQFWLHQTFTLRFDTPHAVVKTVLDRFVEVLERNPEIEKASARARLIGLTPTGPQIEVFAYFQRRGADWAAFLGVQEEIILKMMGIVEAEGTSLAAPVGVVQMGQVKREGSVDRGAQSV